MENVRISPNIKRVLWKLENMERPVFESLGTSLAKINPLEKFELDLKMQY